MVSGPVLEPGWTNEFVTPPVQFLHGGRDRNGWDCWGLLRVVYAERFGIELESFSGDYAGAHDHLAIEGLFPTATSDWVEVDIPREGDAVWMRVYGQPCHVGVWLEGPLLLHVLTGSHTRIDRIGSQAWQHRIKAYYRHRALL